VVWVVCCGLVVLIELAQLIVVMILPVKLCAVVFAGCIECVAERSVTVKLIAVDNTGIDSVVLVVFAMQLVEVVNAVSIQRSRSIVHGTDATEAPAM